MTRTLIVHWNGSAWRQVRSGTAGDLIYNQFTAMTAVSASDAWAVGDATGVIDSHALVAHWNGRRWRRTPSPSLGFEAHVELNGIAVASPSRAWAVGWYLTSQGGLDTLAERWNGTAWQRVPSPNPGGAIYGYDAFEAVAASRSGAWAAGIYSAVKRHAPLTSTLIAHIR